MKRWSATHIDKVMTEMAQPVLEEHNYDHKYQKQRHEGKQGHDRKVDLLEST